MLHLSLLLQNLLKQVINFIFVKGNIADITNPQKFLFSGKLSGQYVSSLGRGLTDSATKIKNGRERPKMTFKILERQMTTYRMYP